MTITMTIIIMMMMIIIILCVDLKLIEALERPRSKWYALPIYGHRGGGCSVAGCSSPLPENSILAVQQAADLEVEGVEVDVWMTKDEELVVFHGGWGATDGFLSDTLMGPNESIETLTYDEVLLLGATKLKEPWVNLMLDKGVKGPVEMFDGESEKRKNEMIEEYVKFNESVKASPSSSPAFRHLPTLVWMLDRFRGKIKFNLELKGSNPKLGVRTLELAKDYPGTIARISSFQWTPPTDDSSGSPCLQSRNSPSTILDDRNLCPNHVMSADLLGPVKGNSLKIPIGLLFNNYDDYLPDLDNMIKMLDHYQAEWAHIYYRFWNTPKAFPSNPQATGKDQLKVLVEGLHEKKKKILTWWGGHSWDDPDDLDINISAEVDAICVNELEPAAKKMEIEPPVKKPKKDEASTSDAKDVFSWRRRGSFNVMMMMMVMVMMMMMFS